MKAVSVGDLPAASTRPKPQLKRGAISYISNVVIGVASTAPGYSLAATLGAIVALPLMGYHAPAVMLVAFLPMFCIALAYKGLNKADPDCGTTFSWMTRAFGPGWGWVGGWAVVLADIVVNASQAQIAGIYTFRLLGADAASQNTLDVTLVGVVWIAVLTLICYIGIELSARTQQVLLSVEVATLLTFAVVALIKVYANNPIHSTHVSADWFNPFALSSNTLILGLLLGVFLYWGWDSGVSVNEETKDPGNAPGRAAVTSTLLLVGIFVIVSTAALAFAGTDYLTKNSSDIFAGGLGHSVLGSGLDKLLIIAVLTSSAAATQTTLLPAARSALSMARRRAIPARFGEIHPEHLTPGFATLVAGGLSIIWYVLIVQVSTNVLTDSVTGLGFLVCFYYGFTGFACAWFYRRELTKSARNFFMLGLLPVIGGLALMGIFVKAFLYYRHAGNTVSKPFLGVGVPVWIGVGGLVLGVIVMFLLRRPYREFFSSKRQVAGDPIETVTPEAEFAPASSML